MLHTKSESDITSLAPSSPSRSPKRPVYYVQSPSRDSHDGDKSSTMQPTPNYNSPMESSSHPSFGRHSRNSSASRFSGIFRSSSGRKGGRKRNDKGWPECNVILEEGKYEEYDDDKRFTRRFQALLALLSFVVLFTVFCLIIWGAARPYKTKVSVKSLTVNNIYVGEGSDSTGVLTKMLTLNGSLRIGVYNPATFFGIHVSSTPINLVYSEISVATGQLKKYYQPRKSHRITVVILEGTKVPLYGAGSCLVPSINNGVQVPPAPNEPYYFAENQRLYVAKDAAQTVQDHYPKSWAAQKMDHRERLVGLEREYHQLPLQREGQFDLQQSNVAGYYSILPMKKL